MDFADKKYLALLHKLQLKSLCNPPKQRPQIYNSPTQPPSMIGFTPHLPHSQILIAFIAC